jgi:16S rRNA (adenine1518-N6/adenine1519-N6)-dimethyltransferase
MHAKKSYGQHFLNRPEIAEKIANSLSRIGETGNRVVEVGPGQGMLTQYLIANKFDLIAVEADRDMVGVLNKKYAQNLAQKDGESGFKVVLEDFMQYDLTKAFDNQSFCLIGNFPYNISSQIIFKMLEHKELIPEMVGMFQKEVADRVVSKAGNKVYGVISLLVQAFYEGEVLFDVGKACFSPPPKVESAVIRLTRKASQDLGCDEKLFKSVVKTAFNQRRKMLRNTMKPLFEDPSVLEDNFFTKRPEQLTLAEFVGLTNKIMAARKVVEG